MCCEGGMFYCMNTKCGQIKNCDQNHESDSPPLKGSACEKVLNSGLGPFKDQTAEMVLFWSFFLQKKSFFPYYDYNALQPCPRY